MYGSLSQQPNTCDPFLNNCDDDGSSTNNTAILQNTTSFVSNDTNNFELRADEITISSYPIVGNETFDVYLTRYLKENPKAVVEQSTGFPSPYPSNTNATMW